MSFFLWNAFELLKARAAAQGETRVRGDGRTYKKIGTKWIVIKNPGGSTKGEKKKLAEATKKGEEYFNYSLTTNLGGVVYEVLESEGITTYESLVEKIKSGPQTTAHKLFKKVVDRIKKEDASSADKNAAIHLIGTTLVTLKDYFSTAPRVTAKIKITPKKGGKAYYKYRKDVNLPLLKPSAIAVAKKKVGGWSVTGQLSTNHVKTMIAEGTATLISGRIDPKKVWVLPKKAEDMELKYKGDSLLIRVKQVREVDKRTRATAKVEIRLPYAFAKAFLMKQISSVRTRNNFIFRMERSAGYRSFLERAGA